MPKPKRKRSNKQPRSKTATPHKEYQSPALRRVLAHVRPTLSDPHEALDDVRATLATNETSNK